MTRIRSAGPQGPAPLAMPVPGQLFLFSSTSTLGSHAHPPTGSPGDLGVDGTHGHAARGSADGIAPALVAPPASRRDLRPVAAPRQARIPAPDDLAAHERAMGAALRVYLPPGKGLDLRLTNNHYSMISVRRKPDGYRLRLHRMFIGVQPRIVRALARYVVHNDRRASGLLGDYIDANQHVIKKQDRKPRQINLRTAGLHHDLQAMFDQLNAQRFSSKLAARITWGALGGRRPRRSIKMGSFAVEDKIIRIHPVLDQPDVPPFFVAWIVFHEMLHEKHDIVRKGRRRIFHSQAFNEEERTYPDYDRATAWDRANLDRLLGG